MQSKATTVAAYLAELPPDRRAALEAVRKVILENLDGNYEEGMQYGMIGYYVPHRVYPAGYHCDPKQPLPFAGLASQKGHMSLYLCSLYGDFAEGELAWFTEAWKKAGKKLDMGKACVRFKRLEDVPLEVVGEAIRRTPAKRMIAQYDAVREAQAAKSGKPPTAKPVARKKAAAKKAASKKAPAKKAGAKKTAAKKTAAKSRAK
ncbi:MAG: DUF1801 domain-containing protein [Planctomycetaceae bacterium]|nr:DUF1801 domain-containing protein [Planctomycetaceae bacterium]